MFLDNRLAGQTTHPAMGTVMAHKAFGGQAEECLSAVREEIDRLENILSRFLPDSDISRINNSAGIQCKAVSSDAYEVLSQAVEFSRQCPGCFDVTVGPLVVLWNSYKNKATPPDESSIQQALPLVNYRDLILDPWELTAGLNHVGQSLDLGGIGKGFAGDRIMEIYQEYGISSAYSNLGGNVVTVGTKPDGSPWQIGIQHPRLENKIIGSVSVVNQTVVTSGDYQRYYTDRQGKRHHHILNPRTGYPSDSGLISVSIVTEKSLAADALSTILFVAGMEKGLGILRSFPQTEAILVDSDLQVYVTPGLRYRFQADQGIGVTILGK
ncbi:MAG TPA: FAD:protein FMN transferase [Anaerolineaceae bacterium]|nr:FAD:protein FMN transferase [Anaerolineaceae bacterium]